MICQKDYLELSYTFIIKYDTRTFKEIYFINLITTHIVLSLFFKKSIIDPLLVRIIYLAFRISLLFTLGAIFYTDNYINAMETTNEDTVNIIFKFRGLSFTQ